MTTVLHGTEVHQCVEPLVDESISTLYGTVHRNPRQIRCFVRLFTAVFSALRYAQSSKAAQLGSRRVHKYYSDTPAITNDPRCLFVPQHSFAFYR